MISLIVASLMGTTVGALVTGSLALIPIKRLTQERDALRVSQTTAAVTSWEDPCFEPPLHAQIPSNGSWRLMIKRLRKALYRPTNSRDLCFAIYNYVAYNDGGSIARIDKLIARGVPVSAYASTTWFTTPLMMAVAGWNEACQHVIRGSHDKRKLIVVLDRLIAAGADPRTIDEHGDTARADLERDASLNTRHWDTAWTEIANEGIALLRDAELAADRRDLESSAQGGAKERAGITRRM